MQKVLIDRNQFVAERLIEMLNNFRITFHDVTFSTVMLMFNLV
ncbi:conserved hypothetical protein [Halomonas sp. 59]|nr:conserved hypothetical protein [Halomonas sp. I3]CAD5274207.1 conserved hypothetical protein [Halomonas sp. 59]VXB87964.1 conserved hypothetical protein [Halomonas titanicae]VXC65939.1 conserved hypothetical protein [Halomonas titanicae]